MSDAELRALQRKVDYEIASGFSPKIKDLTRLFFLLLRSNRPSWEILAARSKLPFCHCPGCDSDTHLTDFLVECDQCGGDRYIELEDGSMPCYHCQRTGLYTFTGCLGFAMPEHGAYIADPSGYANWFCEKCANVSDLSERSRVYYHHHFCPCSKCVTSANREVALLKLERYFLLMKEVPRFNWRPYYSRYSIGVCGTCQYPSIILDPGEDSDYSTIYYCQDCNRDALAELRGRRGLPPPPPLPPLVDDEELPF